MLTIAVAQYQLELLPQWEAYEDKMVRLVEQAKSKEATLLLLSEFSGLELTSWSENRGVKDQFLFLQTQLEAYQELFLSLAEDYEIYIQSGTVPVAIEDGSFRNRAFLFSPKNQIAYQDKLFLSPFEQSTGLFSAGESLECFKTELGILGINVSYDIEFPHIANTLAQSGVQLILVPSYSAKLSGLTRVSIAARARAIENQCYVAQSCLIGQASWCDFIDISVGQSGIYGPADVALTENGILNQSQLNAPMLIESTLDWDKLEYIRQQGETFNFDDMQQDFDLAVNTSYL